MELSELDGFLSRYTFHEIQALGNYARAQKTGESGILYEDYGDYQHFPENISRNRNTPIRIRRHERFIHNVFHSHEFLEIMYQYSGACIQTIDGESMPLSRGEFCFVPPGVIHAPEIYDDSILVNVLIDLSSLCRMCEIFDGLGGTLTEFLCAVAYRKKYPKYLTIRPSKEDAALDRLMRELLLEYYNDEPFCEQMMYTRCQTVFLYLLRKYGGDTRAASDSSQKTETALPVLQYIHNNFRDITLGMLAGTFNYNEQYLCRLIRAQTGRSFQQYLLDLRIGRAKQLLLSTGLSFTEISWDCGYKSNAYFHRVFRETVGMTPMQFRARGTSD